MNNRSEAIRETITKQIASAMSDNLMPWRRTWTHDANSVPMGFPKNFLSNRRYSGINPLVLLMHSQCHGLDSSFWGTHKQWRQLGAFVKPHPATVDPSSWGARIVFWSNFDKPEEGTEDEPKKSNKIWFLRMFTVFNADQVAAPDPEYLLSHPKSLAAYSEIIKSDIKDKVKLAHHINQTVEGRLKQYRQRTEPVAPTWEAFNPAERLMSASGADIRYGGDKAFYMGRPGDYIKLPHKDQFESPAAFYETAFHELIHWCEDDQRIGAPKPDDIRHRYAYGELVAEIGACFLAQILGVPFAQELLPNNKSYLKAWLDRMGGDSKFIFQASSQASKAVDYLISRLEISN